MPRRDELTYDVQERRPRGAGPSPALLVLLIALLVFAALLVVWTVRSSYGGRSASPPVHPANNSSTVVQTPRASASSPAAPSSAPTGSDAIATKRAPDGSEAAARQFVAAWLDPEPKSRKTALQRTAAPELAAQLTLTSTANIPRAKPDGEPVLDDASTYSAQFVQRLSDGMKIRVYLSADPQARNGWVATSVEKA